MKVNSMEVIKNDRLEALDMQELLRETKLKVSNEEMNARKAEEEAQSLELELKRAQAAHEMREEAEKKGKETNEKVTELIG